MIKIIKDPFIHFMVIGAALFAVYEFNRDADEGNINQITISEIEVNNAINGWEKRWQRLPSDKELQAVLEQKVRQEVFYREALALNLGQDDPVVRRRLAEKMMFIANDLVVPEQASDKQLTAFMQSSPDKFTKPVITTFKHVYFNPDLHNIETAELLTFIEEQRKALNDDREPPIDYQTLSDDFYNDLSIQNIPEYQIARIFGKQFTQELAQVPSGEWYGPITSGYGKHLIKMEYRSEPELTPLSDIRDKVLASWKVAQQKQSNDSLYESLRGNYDVVIEKTTMEREN
ncbi:hypothetical protein [Aliivibrio sifiae]|uniref:peptidylprolyl isomerase n=1 Tax=Aliivibrio sifiae TaxID=566293 RepID=UPI003D0DFE3E